LDGASKLRKYGTVDIINELECVCTRIAPHRDTEFGEPPFMIGEALFVPR
jgi:hypothetical protein